MIGAFMLYERWRQIAREHADEVAVRDIAARESMTFGELASAIESTPAPEAAVFFPQGHDIGFVRTVLLGWKHGRIICPLEQGHVVPDAARRGRLALPPHCAQLKLTSATTGAARMIVFREEQIFADAQNIVSTMDLRAEWPNAGFISLAHSYGFSNLVLPLLLFGIPLVLAKPPLPEMLRAVAKETDAIAARAGNRSV